MSMTISAMKAPPRMAMISAKKVSSGKAISSAMTRGSTSTSIGSRPRVRMASTSSFTCMVPIWAVKALPDRPAMMMARDQHTHLAQHGNADEIDGQQFLAELAQLIVPLIGDDDADEEQQQSDDRHGIQAMLFDIADQRCEPNAAGMPQHAAEREQAWRRRSRSSRGPALPKSMTALPMRARVSPKLKPGCGASAGSSPTSATRCSSTA